MIVKFGVGWECDHVSFRRSSSGHVRFSDIQVCCGSSLIYFSVTSGDGMWGTVPAADHMTSRAAT